MAQRSVALSASASQTCPVYIFRNGGKHFGVDSQVSNGLKLALLDGHRLSCESLTHPLGLHSSLVGVDSSRGVIASLPADGNRGIVAK